MQRLLLVLGRERRLVQGDVIHTPRDPEERKYGPRFQFFHVFLPTEDMVRAGWVRASERNVPHHSAVSQSWPNPRPGDFLPPFTPLEQLTSFDVHGGSRWGSVRPESTAAHTYEVSVRLDFDLWSSARLAAEDAAVCVAASRVRQELDAVWDEPGIFQLVDLYLGVPPSTRKRRREE